MESADRNYKPNDFYIGFSPRRTLRATLKFLTTPLNVGRAGRLKDPAIQRPRGRAFQLLAKHMQANPFRAICIPVSKTRRRVAIFLMLLPALLAPTHPLSVYGYLADNLASMLSPSALAASEDDLHPFLLSSSQLARYKTDLRDDMLDTRSGRLFAIVRRSDGTLVQERIRTWNGFLPARVPKSLSRWLDRKEFPFLGDEVGIWARGDEIVAMGHYHAFGGGPSEGDHRAECFSRLPEIIVSNGLIPMIYIDGEVLSFSEDTVVAEKVYRVLRTMEPSLMMEPDPFFQLTEKAPATLAAFLSYLRVHRAVDIDSAVSVADSIRQLRTESMEAHKEVFSLGFHPADYTDNPDMHGYARHLDIIREWLVRVDGLVVQNTERLNQP